MINPFSFKPIAATVLAGMMGMSVEAVAQSVIFPQVRQAGVAVYSKTADAYVLKNQLLTATFQKQGSTLVFGGCPELNLEAGTELFEIKTGDGSTTVKASEMTLVGDVREVALTGDSRAVKGSKRFAGKAIEADFRHGDLNLTWRAVLRDDSHYLRTELSLTADRDVKMFSVTPMTYSVNVQAAGSTPRVVGNTRGAVLLSEKIFAGLETPTGLNSVGNGSSEQDFTYDRWTAESFGWAPGEETPQGILSLGYTAAQVAATKGYLSFKEAGPQTVTFQYTGGTHRLNIVGVDLVDLDGNVVAHDYHFGYTGSAKDRNVYTLDVPQRGVYIVRYFMETRTETITSAGSITFSKKVTPPVLVYDLAPGSSPVLSSGGSAAPTARRSRALSASTISEGDVLTDNWVAATWQQHSGTVPPRINELGYAAPNVYSIVQPLNVATKGALTAEFNYASGPNRLNLCGVDIVDSDGTVVTYDYHLGFTGSAKQNNAYTFNVPYAGNFRLRYFVQNKSEAINSTGNISVKLVVQDTLHLAASPTMPIRGVWSRNTTLQAGKTWEVGAVVGLVAQGQPRRSFLAYSERERAVPWRAMPAYISWYELNINRNNDPNYTNNMNIGQCVDIVKQWKTNLYDRYGEYVNSYVWDDGWDEYGTWTFNKNFPNGFQEIDALVKQMGSGQGAWLGPVGGYGESGTYRRNYWKNQGGMQLSNPAYYQVFTDAITNLCKTQGYDFRFFKFDGISAQFSAVGPDPGTTGEENAEGIISAERMVRKDIKEDIFFNTSVGTWASPFWFNVTDAIWRQESDYGEIGNQGTDREKWITYRDRLVYQNFVQNSPICPINTLMTHGFILTKWGDVSRNMDYEGIVRELRCAFACGSGMVELYNDYALMNSINGGRLWGDLAECLRWQRKNADVLPDAHWVGGNPWDGVKANVYGWAAWNGERATLALRNPAASAATYKTTLRRALEIPAHVNGSIILHKSFGTQAALNGLTEDQPINIDTELTLSLPASSVYVFDGRNEGTPEVALAGVSFKADRVRIPKGRSQALVWDILPVDATRQEVAWQSATPAVATVQNGVVKALTVGETVITVTNAAGQQDQVTVEVYEAPYAISFDESNVLSKNNWFLNTLTFTPSGETAQAVTLNSDKKSYQDHTQKVIEAKPGATVNLTTGWNGSWMHGYVYIDLDGNRKFDVTGIDSPELVAAHYLSGQKKENGTVSSGASNNPSLRTFPAFRAPATPGLYRLRVKVDWDSASPEGSTAVNNDIIKNSGSITDVMLRVVAADGTVPMTVGEAKYVTFYNEKPYVMPEGMQGAVITAVNTEQTRATADFRFPSGSIVPTQTPLLLKANPGNYTVTWTADAAEISAEGNLLQGTSSNGNLPAESGHRRYIFTKDAVKGLGFFFQGESNDGALVGNIAGKAYLDLSGAAAQAGVSGFTLSGLTAVEMPLREGSAVELYDLSGRRSTGDARGVYIANGKKVIK